MNEKQQEVFNKTIDHLVTGSDRMIDNKLFPRLLALKDRGFDCKDEVLGIIHDTQYFALSSDFVVRVFYILWEMCGGTNAQLTEVSELLQKPKTKEEYKSLSERFKWCCDYSEQMNVTL